MSSEGYPPTQTPDTDAGAAGSAGGFTLSTAGLAAVIIVVVLVVCVGIGTTILFVIAKRRQITLRQSAVYASRRLTGRANRDGTLRTGDRRSRRAQRQADRQSRREGLQLDGRPTARGEARQWPGKREVVVEMRDVEKGLPGRGEKGVQKENWATKFMKNDWK